MSANSRRLAVLPLFAAATTVLSTAVVTPAWANDLGFALYNEVNAVHMTTPKAGPFGLCGGLTNHPQLSAAAQRHANDMLNSGVTRHAGSDGSTTESRITDTGAASSRKAEIVYWATGSEATPQAAVKWWMNSPGHRAIIMDCRLTAAGAATASDGKKMTAVVNFTTL